MTEATSSAPWLDSVPNACISDCALEAPESPAFSAERTVLREPKVRWIDGAPDLELAKKGWHCRVIEIVIVIEVAVMKGAAAVLAVMG